MDEKQKKMRLQANAEANQRAAYYLIDHIARSDDEYLVAAALKLATTLQKRAKHYKEKANSI